MVEPVGARGGGIAPGPGTRNGARAMARAMPGGTTAGLPGRLRRVLQQPPGAPARRPWRMVLGLGLLGAGLYAMLDDPFALTTDTAVVSAYTISLRSPIAGQVGGLRHSPGEAITAGTLVAVVEDDRADPRPLAELRATHDHARAELANAEAARDAFRAILADRIGPPGREPAEAARPRPPRSTGAAEPRPDELALRLAEQEREVGTLRAGLALAEARLEAGRRHAGQQALAELSSPSAGLVWRLLAQDGERIAAGDTVAEVMDCANAFVLAVVPQDRAAEVQVGGIARFRLAGEGHERSGRVQAVLGEGSVAGGRNLAALPGRLAQGGALVRVALTPPAAGAGADCPVGRGARLLLPTGEAGTPGRRLVAR